MDKNRFAAILVVFLVLVLRASGLSQSVEDMRKEMSTLESEIARLDKMIQDNSVLVAMLRGHGTRLRVVADDPNVYRLPLLIEGRVVYTTVDDAELEDFSLSLALEDLLIRYRVSKGSFRSDDPAGVEKNPDEGKQGVQRASPTYRVTGRKKQDRCAGSGDPSVRGSAQQALREI